MTIPSNITTELQNLQNQVAAAAPLNGQPFAAIKALQLNAGNLVNDIQTALTAASTLDTWTAALGPVNIVSGIEGVVTAAEDQANLALMRGIVGRAALNLNQLV